MEVNEEYSVILQQAQDPNTGEVLYFIQGENGEAIQVQDLAFDVGQDAPQDSNFVIMATAEDGSVPTEINLADVNLASSGVSSAIPAVIPVQSDVVLAPALDYAQVAKSSPNEISSTDANATQITASSTTTQSDVIRTPISDTPQVSKPSLSKKNLTDSSAASSAPTSSPIIPVQPDVNRIPPNDYSKVSKVLTPKSTDASLLADNVTGQSQLAASRRTYSKKSNIVWLNPEPSSQSTSPKTKNLEEKKIELKEEVKPEESSQPSSSPSRRKTPVETTKRPPEKITSNGNETNNVSSLSPVRIPKKSHKSSDSLIEKPAEPRSSPRKNLELRQNEALSADLQPSGTSEVVPEVESKDKKSKDSPKPTPSDTKTYSFRKSTPAPSQPNVVTTVPEKVKEDPVESPAKRKRGRPKKTTESETDVDDEQPPPEKIVPNGNETNKNEIKKISSDNEKNKKVTSSESDSASLKTTSNTPSSKSDLTSASSDTLKQESSESPTKKKRGRPRKITQSTPNAKNLEEKKIELKEEVKPEESSQPSSSPSRRKTPVETTKRPPEKITPIVNETDKNEKKISSDSEKNKKVTSSESDSTPSKSTPHTPSSKSDITSASPDTLKEESSESPTKKKRGRPRKSESVVDVDDQSSNRQATGTAKKKVCFNLDKIRNNSDVDSPTSSKSTAVSTPSSLKRGARLTKKNKQPGNSFSSTPLTPILKSSVKSSTPGCGKVVVSYGSPTSETIEEEQRKNLVDSLQDMRSSKEFYDFQSNGASFHVRHQSSNLTSFTPRGSSGNYVCPKCGYQTARMNNLVLHHKDQCPVVRLHWQNEINRQAKKSFERTSMEHISSAKKSRYEEALNHEDSQDDVDNDFIEAHRKKLREKSFDPLPSSPIVASAIFHSDVEDDDFDTIDKTKKKFGFAENDCVWTKWSDVHWPALVVNVNEKDQTVTFKMIDNPSNKKCITTSIDQVLTFNEAERNKKFLRDGKAVMGDSLVKAVQKAEDYSRKLCLGDESGAAKLFGTMDAHYDSASEEERHNDDRMGYDSHKNLDNGDTNDSRLNDESDGNDDYIGFQSPETIAQWKGYRKAQNAKLFECIKEGKIESHLLGIYKETIQSDRHKKFKEGSAAEKSQLTHVPWFGPVDDDDQQEEIYDYCSQLFKNNFKPDVTFDSVAYLFEVWVPEAIVKAISKTRMVDMTEAEAIFSKGVILSRSEKNQLEKEIMKETESKAQNENQSHKSPSPPPPTSSSIPSPPPMPETTTTTTMATTASDENAEKIEEIKKPENHEQPAENPMKETDVEQSVETTS